VGGGGGCWHTRPLLLLGLDGVPFPLLLWSPTALPAARQAVNMCSDAEGTIVL